jgi:cobalamin biosynthesis Mg chelatase CobN
MAEETGALYPQTNPVALPAAQMNQMGLRPIPDPTSLTTEALQREIRNLGDTLRAELKIESAEASGGRLVITTRIDGIERDLFNLGALVKERFDIIERQRVEQKQDNEKAVQAALLAAEKAVQAALLAQKEAVREQTAASALAISKSESSTAAQQSQQYATITAELKAVTDRLGEQGNRITTIESTKLGSQQSSAGLQTNIGLIISVVLFVIALIGFFALRAPQVVEVIPK